MSRVVVVVLLAFSQTWVILLPFQAAETSYYRWGVIFVPPLISGGEISPHGNPIDFIGHL